MKVEPNPRYTIFVEALRPMRARMVHWSGSAYRAAELDFIRSSDLMSGDGAFKYGGRWNAPGSFRCVYLSTTGETAYAESIARFRYHGFTPRTPEPRVIVGIELVIHAMLDLSVNDGTPANVGFAELLTEDWRKVNDGGSESLGQALGRAATNAGVEAMLVPSAEAYRGTNVVLFMKNIRSRHVFHVVGHEKLDRLIHRKYV